MKRSFPISEPKLLKTKNDAAQLRSRSGGKCRPVQQRRNGKANSLKVYDYLELLLTELPKHAEDSNCDFPDDLLPWSKTVQEKCSNRKKS